MNLTPSISAFPDPEFVQFFVVPAVHRYQKDVLKSSRWCNGGLAGHLPHRRGVTNPPALTWNGLNSSLQHGAWYCLPVLRIQFCAGIYVRHLLMAVPLAV